MRLSVIVPMLNEERAIGATLDALRRGAPQAEIVVVDGGSTDRSAEIAESYGVEFARAASDACPTATGGAGAIVVLRAARGRARQMNVGARAAGGEALVFVHADTLVPVTFHSDVAAALSDPRIIGGRFDLALDEPSLAGRLLGRLISLRSRVMRTATGDQAIFVRREVFEGLGGFAEIELCEDIDFARRLKRTGRVACLRSRVITSARRWRRNGLIRTVLKMWIIKSLFLAGVSPAWLRRHYADTR
jgi:rSAM/selenodomain-associated transferase 2